MKTKLFEIRDRGTFIAAIGIKIDMLDCINNSEEFLLRRAGYGGDGSLTLLTKLEGGEACYDPYDWKNPRTMGNAHKYIMEHFDELTSGAVVDVEFILGETKEPKQSEMTEEY